MGIYVRGADIGTGWLNAFRVLEEGGEAVNLAVDIEDPLMEDLGVRGAIESELATLKRTHPSTHGGVQSMHTVANTIFPISLYRPGSGDASERFIANALRSEGNRGHARQRQWGSYLGRLVAYPARDGASTNQLQIALGRLASPGSAWSDVYEMPIAVPERDDGSMDWDLAATAGIVLQADSRTDARFRGGPCLAHISLTLVRGELSMMALYRRHSYVTRAYGNFLGLARLLAFLARESGHGVGNLLVVTGHGVVDAPNRRSLLAKADAAAGTATPIETTARPLGAMMSDLDLPAAVS